MSEHYYSQKPASAHAPHVFTVEHAGRALTFETDAGVFSKNHLDKGTALLIRTLPKAQRGRALDLGCGWGAVGVCMAAAWHDAAIVMSDINERAVELSRRNLARNGLQGTVVQGDGIAHLEGLFDLIAINPPIRAGKAVIYRLFEQSVAKLEKTGILYVVMRKQQGAPSAARHLKTLFAQVKTVAHAGGFHVLRAGPEAGSGGVVMQRTADDAKLSP